MNANDVFTHEHTTALDHGNRLANDGYVFVCSACGKRSRDRYGNKPISRGWDESCALNCVLVREYPDNPDATHSPAK